MQDIELTDLCYDCSECCKNFLYFEINSDEVKLLEKATGLNSDKFINIKEKTIPKEYFFKFQENGDCFFLVDGNYCGVYNSRPRVCREYPSKLKQIKFCESNKIL